jgi:hypothetical protein
VDAAVSGRSHEVPGLLTRESQIDVVADYRLDTVASKIAASIPAGTLSLSAIPRLC